MGTRRKPMQIFPDEVLALQQSGSLPVLIVDWQITRRQRIHAVSFPDGREYFTSRHLADCLEHVHALGHTELVIACETARHDIRACRITLADLVEDIDIPAVKTG